MERELNVVTHENELRSGPSITTTNERRTRLTHISINAIGVLIDYFHGHDGSFQKWEKEINFLHRTDLGDDN